MSELLAKIVPLAIAAAINPTGILVLVVLLATSKRTGLAYSVGFCATFAGFGVVVLALGLRLQLKPSATSAVIDLVAAALIAYLGVLALRKRPKPEGEKKRALGTAGGLAAGVGLAVTDFSSVIPYLVALKEMMISGLGRTDVWAALVVFLAIMLAPLIVPVALSYAAPKTAGRVLDPLRRVLTKHGQKIIAVVCFVIAAYLAVKGVRGL